MGKVEYIPASKSKTYLDKQMFATIVCMIPAGKLTTSEAIFEMWAKRKGADYCELGGGIMPFDRTLFWKPTDVQRVDTLGELNSYLKIDDKGAIPYWRIISKTGALVDFGQYSSKETQKAHLEREGHTIVQPNPEKRLYRVVNYKDALFDLNKLVIKE